VIAWSLGLGLPLALALTMTALLSVPTDATPLSVDNPGPDGARAVAQVLARQGVTVVAAADTATAVAQASGDTTLVIAGPSPVSGRQLDWYAQADCDIVLIDPDPKLRDHLEAAIVENRLTVVEDPDVFANAGIVEGDNAATALRTLGAHRRLVWSVASWEEDDAGGAGGVWQLLPPWAGLVAVQLLIAAAGAAVWRGRRMGRLAPDELPVSVPASQITTGLGQLYRRGRALGHAGAALRGGTAARIGGGLGLGPATAPATLVARVARALGRAEPPIRELLYGPPPRSAAELTALARALDELEQEVAGR
jgi:hypothetical protein